MSVSDRHYRYGLRINGLDAVLGVVRFTMTEGLSKSFALEVQFVSSEAIELSSAIGVNASLTIINASDEVVRQFSGHVAKLIASGISQQGSYNYSITVVPLSWFLSKRSTSRLYQRMTVQDIIVEKLELAGIPGDQYEFLLSGDHSTQEYCTQYQETDLDFVQRIMDEEGLFYFFRHDAEKHVLVIADDPSAYQPLESPNKVFRYASSLATDTPFISQLNIQHQAVETAISMRDYDFMHPSLRQQGYAQSDDLGLESYVYPGKFSDPDQGEVKAQRLLEKRQVFRQFVDLRSNYPDLSSGSLLSISEHGMIAPEDEWLIVEVVHSGTQGQANGVLSAGGNTYNNKATLIPSAVPFRPGKVIPKPQIVSTQTAIVVGPEGEDIYTDEFGRVKLQFHWDRQGQYDENSSCWVRVSQSWAGAGWGSFAIPRIGQEVVVQFIEGDPDRPLVTGCLYDAIRKMPYDLPDAKTKTVLKTNSSPEGGGFNELSFDDQKGEESIYFHAERNVEKRIKNDDLQWVGNDQHSIVKNDQISLVEGDVHQSVMGDNFERIDGSMSMQVGADVQLKCGGEYGYEAGGDVHIKAGANLVLEAGSEVTIKVGGNFVKIDSSGVTIVGGSIKLNSGGSAGNGKGVAIDEPLEALEAGEREAAQAVEAPEKPESYSPAAMTLKQAATEGAATVAPCEGA